MDITPTRRQQLEDGIQRDLDLLKEYEDKLRLSDDPKEQARCHHEIEALKASIADKKAELRSLSGPEPSAIPPAGKRPTGEWPIVDVEHLHGLITHPDGPDPIWLLGAGASWKSGVPLSGTLVERAAKWAYCRAHRRTPDDPTVMHSDWLPWLHRQSWYDPDQSSEAQYATSLSHLLQPAEERREFFRRLGRPGIPPSEGYHRLLDLMAARRVRSVLTTNFDTVLPDLSVTVPNPRHVTIVRTSSDCHHFSTAPIYPQVIYLYGDAERYADGYFDRGHERLDDVLIEHLIPLLRDHPLIVVGYSGAEPAVMHHLLRDNIERVHRFRCGLYWCVLNSEYPHRLNPFVYQLANAVGPNFRFVLIEGFDELLTHLWETNQATPSPIIALTPTPTVTAPPTFDLQMMDVATLDDLDWPMVESHLVEYCHQMNIAVPTPVTRGWLVEQMQVQGLAADDNGTIRPTMAGILLFAKDPTNRLPTARIEVHVAGEEPRTFGGNLWQQLTVVNLIENEFNIPFRLKGPKSKTVTPYPPLALKELIVNALAHRRYDGDAHEAIIIRIESDHITIANPGGLHEEARRQLPPDVQPEKALGIQPIKGYRNPVIADFFYSSGEMDKLGSGLLDVCKWARHNKGNVGFRLGPDNAFFEVTFYRRPERPDEETGAASPLSLPGEFISNVLEVVELPNTVWSDATTYRHPLEILSQSRDQNLPAFALYEGRLYTFSDLSRPDNPLSQFVQGTDLRPMPLDDFATGEVGERRLVHLLNEALRGFVESKGLIFDWDRKRVYFPRTDEGERPITYQARLRQATRTVVKARISSVTNEVIYWEHQALVFQFKRFGDTWGLQLLPTYVFTSDGYHARLPGERSGPLATRRLSREYNVHVDSHLVFWTTMFSNGALVIFLEDSFGSRIVLRGSPAACALWELEPQPEGDELPLLSEEDLDELETQMAELNGEDWEDDEPDD